MADQDNHAWCCSYHGAVPTMRRARGSRALSLSPRLVPPYVAAIVLGILGVHALAQHCPAPSEGVALIGTSISHGTPLQHAHHAASAVGLVVEAAPSALASIAVDLGDLLMICAAMLVGAGVTLALWLRRRGSPAGLPMSPLRLAVPPPTQAAAASGPPLALAFTVIRC